MFWKKNQDSTAKKWIEDTISKQTKFSAVNILWTEMMANTPDLLISPLQTDNASMLDIWTNMRIGSFSIWFDNDYEFEALQIADITKQLELIGPLLKRDRINRLDWNTNTIELNSIITAQYKKLLKWGFEVGEKVSSDNYLFKEVNNIADINFLLEGFLQKLGDELIKWQVFRLRVKHSNSSFECPKTIFEILFDDVTLITKRIALAAKFGPEPILTIERLVDEVKKTDKEKGNNLLDVISKVIKLDDPDLYVK